MDDHAVAEGVGATVKESEGMQERSRGKSELRWFQGRRRVFARFASERRRLRGMTVRAPSGTSSSRRKEASSSDRGYIPRRRGEHASPVVTAGNLFDLGCTTKSQLVCGSSENLNPMILGTDPSRRVPESS